MDLENIKSLGKRSLFELGLKLQPEQFDSMIQSLLTGLSVNLVDAMIERNVPWPVTDEQIVRISDFREFMTHLTAERVFDLLESSRPDLAETIEKSGEKGAVWFATNVQNLHDRIMAVPTPPQTEKEYEQLEEQPELTKPLGNVAGDGQEKLMAMACASCEGKWLVLQDDLDKVRGCPFCLAEAPVRKVPDDVDESRGEEKPGPRLRI